MARGCDRDDGELQTGVEWPAPRFTDNLDGTVRDNQIAWSQSLEWGSLGRLGSRRNPLALVNGG